MGAGHRVIRVFKWAVLLGVIGVLIAPAKTLPWSTKLLTLAFASILTMFWLKQGLVRLIKSEPKAPAWDEIQSVPPVVPEPPFNGGGTIGRAIRDYFAKWTMNRKNKDDPVYLNAMGEMFDIGTKYTPKNPVEAMRWYKTATGGDPVKANGPHYAKLRIAEMYEDGEGVPRDLNEAGRIYKTIPHFPSARLHFAIAHVEGRGVPRDYIEAYRLALLADRFYSWQAPSRKQVEGDPGSHRQNRRHIRTRELMAILEARMAPEQLIKAREAARAWWNTHR